MRERLAEPQAQRERDALLVCAHSRPDWDRLGMGRWGGVPLRGVLAAGFDLEAHDPSVTDVVMEAVDGYRQVLPHGATGHHTVTVTAR